jgi:hypothetical protein
LEQKLGGGDATGTKSGARLVGEVHPGEVVNNIQPQMGIAHTYTYTYTYTYIYTHVYIRKAHKALQKEAFGQRP